MKQAHTFVLMAAVAGAPLSLSLAHVSTGALEVRAMLNAASALHDNAVTPLGQISPTSIYLQSGIVDTLQPGDGGDLASLVNLIAAERNTLIGRSFVIQLTGPMQAEWRTQLSAAGVDVREYLPVNSFIVRLNNADAAKVGKLGFVRWYSEYLAAWKIAPGIGQRQYFTPERINIAAAGQVVVGVNLFQGEPAPAMVGIISNFPGAQVHWVDNAGGTQLISATMNPEDVSKLAALPQVQWVEEGPDVDVRNDTDRWIVQSDIPNVTPLYTAGIHGEGQILGLLDLKVNQNHCSFFDSQPIGPLHRKIVAYNASAGSQFHGTHTCGTAVGDHGDNTATRGIAYLGKVAYNVIPAFTETGMVTSCNLHHTQGARVHSNSWGDDGTTSYNSLCRGVDIFSYNNEDDLILFAVTNTGSLKNPENAKNLLAVGASQDTPSENSFCSGGSGPTSDGRRKPEIYAPGCNTNSADNSTSCGTTTATGTSMACPAVAASGMLVRQYYMNGYYPTGVAVPSDAFTPSGALIKATLLNSAVDMTGIGGYPSNQEGWGRVLLDNALFFPSDTRRSLIEDVRNASGLVTAQQTEYPVPVLGSGQRLNITLVWTEPPAASGAGFAAVNDLDLEVVAPDSTLYKGNVFTTGQSSTGGSRDDRNNVEQVQLAAPMTGVWTVRVKGTAVNVGTQGYAIVVSGDISSTAGVSIVINSPTTTLVPPGDPFVVGATIYTGSDALVAGSPTLHYRFDAGAYQDVPMTLMSGQNYSATIPAPACGDVPEFYVSAEGVTSGIVDAPPSGSAAPVQLTVGTPATLADDTFETDTGWASVWPDDTTTVGRWVRVDPNVSAAAPADDHTPGTGVNCWVTGQENPLGGGAINDVDSGSTSLVSPVLDLSTASSAVASYWRWYNNSTGAGANSDVFLVQASGDNGASWTTIETVGPTGEETQGGWFFHQVDLSGLVSFTSQVRVRFVAQDLGVDSTIEAGVDDFRLDAVVCVNACACDWNNSGSLDSQDFFDFITAFFTSSADFNHDGMTNSQDFFDFLACFFGGC